MTNEQRKVVAHHVPYVGKIDAEIVEDAKGKRWLLLTMGNSTREVAKVHMELGCAELLAELLRDILRAERRDDVAHNDASC